MEFQMESQEDGAYCKLPHCCKFYGVRIQSIANPTVEAGDVPSKVTAFTGRERLPSTTYHLSTSLQSGTGIDCEFVIS
jgi:hypothetical protein